MGREPRRIAIGIDLIWPYKHHTDIVAGVLAYGRERGWTCELEPFLEKAGVEGFRGRPFDGVIARVMPPLAAYARRVGLPLINVWVDSPVRGVPAVHPGVKAAGEMAARHLLDRGYRRLGVLGHRGSRNAEEVAAGVRAATSRMGASCDVMKIAWTDFPDGRTWNRLQRDLAGWIRTWKPPVGIVVTDDPTGRHFAGACLRRGLRIPDDVAVVTIGNTELLCEKLAPTLTSVEQGLRRVGYEAARWLDRMMGGRPAPARPVYVRPAAVVTRLSTSAFAVGDPVVSRALRFVAANARRPIRVHDVVAAQPVTRRSLERRFRRVLGRSIHDEITRVRLERAKRQLVETDAPLKTIAADTGFRQAEILAKVFRQVEGESPGAFRRERRRG